MEWYVLLPPLKSCIHDKGKIRMCFLFTQEHTSTHTLCSMETATARKATDLSHGEPPQDMVPEYL